MRVPRYTSQVVPSDKLTRREVDFVLRRAAEIDTQDPARQERATDETLSVGELVRLGEEAGLPSEAVEQALTELRRGASLEPEEKGTLARTLGATVGPGGRIAVAPDLSVPGHPEVFAVGDIATGNDAKGRPLPGVAQVAIQGGRHAGRMISAQLEGRRTTPFRYFDKGSMATIGRHDAVAELPGGIRLTGTVGWLAWLGLHLLYLIGFRNRANVLVNWTWNYLTYDRGSRIIGEDIDSVT